MNNEIEINGEIYVKKNINKDKKCMMIRTYSAGVFCGYIEKQEDSTITLTEARRIWSWEGAASLSQLAIEGTSKPKECRFPCAVDRITLFNVIEIIEMTDKAVESIKKVPIWSA